MSVLEVQILSAQYHGCQKKTIIMVFTLDLLMRAFSDKENFSCDIPHFAVWFSGTNFAQIFRMCK